MATPFNLSGQFSAGGGECACLPFFRKIAVQKIENMADAFANKIKRLELENFTCFGKVSLDFSPDSLSVSFA